MGMATAVIVGTAITRPETLTRDFVAALAQPRATANEGSYVLAIDIGGTNIKSGVVSASGERRGKRATPTPIAAGATAVVETLRELVRAELEDVQASGYRVVAVGVATAGWVDSATGRLVYATGTLPGWAETPLRTELAAESQLPVFVENDAHAFTRGERQFGAAKGVDDFLCITLGTGVGGGCYSQGSLLRGANSLANAVGHIVIRPGGRLCACGNNGCLEPYANAAALVRAADTIALTTAQQVIVAANAGHPKAIESIEQCAVALAEGCTSVIHLLDPRMIILAGGVLENNPLLLAAFERALRQRVMAWDKRNLTVRTSSLGYYGGVLGAAALAWQRLQAA